jgi:hypothetical protein
MLVKYDKGSTSYFDTGKATFDIVSSDCAEVA